MTTESFVMRNVLVTKYGTLFPPYWSRIGSSVVLNWTILSVTSRGHRVYKYMYDVNNTAHLLCEQNSQSFL